MGPSGGEQDIEMNDNQPGRLYPGGWRRVRVGAGGDITLHQWLSIRNSSEGPPVSEVEMLARLAGMGFPGEVFYDLSGSWNR